MGWTMLLNPKVLAAIAFAAVLAFAGVQTMRLDSAKNEHLAFVAKTEALGEAAKAQAVITEAHNKERKEKADAENSAALATLAGTIQRLRDKHSPGGVVSAPAVCPASPEGAARFQSEYLGAYRDLVGGLREEGDRGSKAVTKLNTAKEWAQDGNH